MAFKCCQIILRLNSAIAQNDCCEVAMVKVLDVSINGTVKVRHVSRIDQLPACQHADEAAQRNNTFIGSSSGVFTMLQSTQRGRGRCYQHRAQRTYILLGFDFQILSTSSFCTLVTPAWIACIAQPGLLLSLQNISFRKNQLF